MEMPDIDLNEGLEKCELEVCVIAEVFSCDYIYPRFVFHQHLPVVGDYYALPGDLPDARIERRVWDYAVSDAVVLYLYLQPIFELNTSIQESAAYEVFEKAGWNLYADKSPNA